MTFCSIVEMCLIETQESSNPKRIERRTNLDCHIQPQNTEYAKKKENNF